MDQTPIWVITTLFFLLFSAANSEEEEVKEALVRFMAKLSAGKVRNDRNWGWNLSSDPCEDNWRGVYCDSALKSVKKIVLDRYNLTGVIDAGSLCAARSLAVLSLNRNNLTGGLTEEISNCKRLTHVYLSGNHLSGHLPGTLSRLSNLNRIDISENEFSGELPDLLVISGLLTFRAQNNQLTGEIPKFNFSNLVEFNVSYNSLTGPIPDLKGRFGENSFLGNPQLCGNPRPTPCPAKKKASSKSKNQILIYSGYIILAVILALLLSIKLFKNHMPKAEAKIEPQSQLDSTTTFGDTKSRANIRSEYSITSAESGMTSSSLVVLSTPAANGLRFENLLRSPAKLMGRGKHGSLYKVTLENGLNLAVKRIKNWGISREDFRRRMQRIDGVKHRNLLPAMAYYCSNEEKLLVYEYQPNGSLFNLLQGTQNGQVFDWGSRLELAATVAEALAYNHSHLQQDGIAHGNLKSSNILFNKHMRPCISEYGLFVVENQDNLSLSAKENALKNSDPAGGRAYSTFKVDIYAFGVILLELLTGKIVKNGGFDLAKWVDSVVREEWTTEVFDKVLVSEGASEERMMELLHVALKCIHHSPEVRPSMGQVAWMINSIKEDEERSMGSEASEI